MTAVEVTTEMTDSINLETVKSDAVLHDEMATVTTPECSVGSREDDDIEDLEDVNVTTDSAEMLLPDREVVMEPDPHKKTMQTFEIDTGDTNSNDLVINQSISLDEEDAEQQGLLSNGVAATADTASMKKVKNKFPFCFCTEPIERVGNLYIFWPSHYYRTGWGIYGPHWFGPPCVLGIIWVASAYFIHASIVHVGYITALICTIWTCVTSYNLINVAFRDPGLCRSLVSIPPNATNPRQYRWCDFCQVYQPPNGAHCADCNVCVAGYDHHCAWMGLCIGRNNVKQFIRFNLSWLGYLIYAVVWVSFVGRLTSSK